MHFITQSPWHLYSQHVSSHKSSPPHSAFTTHHIPPCITPNIYHICRHLYSQHISHKWYSSPSLLPHSLAMYNVYHSPPCAMLSIMYHTSQPPNIINAKYPQTFTLILCITYNQYPHKSTFPHISHSVISFPLWLLTPKCAGGNMCLLFADIFKASWEDTW